MIETITSTFWIAANIIGFLVIVGAIAYCAGTAVQKFGKYMERKLRGGRMATVRK